MELQYSKSSKKEFEKKELVEFILSKEYGTTIGFYECADILKYNIDDIEEYHKFMTCMNKIKNILINYGYILITVSHKGFYILKPTEISDHCYTKYINKTARTLDKSEKILKHVDNINFSEDRQKQLQDIKKLNKDLQNVIDNTIISSGYYKRRLYYNSLED